ncbi:MAG: hypothetical protein M3N24_00815 [Actinomycetota bacterium]|nr:hypothetical protein [Actinomycetota bacterium]
MKKAAVLLAATAFLLLAAPAAFANHGGPHCAKSQGKGTQGGTVAGNSGQPCEYPPGQSQQVQQAPGQAKKSFEFPRQTDGGITFGMLVIAGLGAFTVMLGARAVRRRLIS